MKLSGKQAISSRTRLWNWSFNSLDESDNSQRSQNSEISQEALDRSSNTYEDSSW